MVKSPVGLHSDVAEEGDGVMKASTAGGLPDAERAPPEPEDLPGATGKSLRGSRCRTMYVSLV